MDLQQLDVALVTAWGRYAGQQIMTTHTYTVIETNPGNDANVAVVDLLDKVRAGAGGGDILETALLSCITNDYLLERWTAQIIKANRLVVHSFDRNVFGGLDSPPNTANVAACITLRTAAAGRTQVSNKHIGPAPTAAAYAESGSWKAAYKLLLNDLKSAFLTGYTDLIRGIVWRPCIYHRTAPLGPSVVTSGVAQPTVRVQRRRTVGVGI